MSGGHWNYREHARRTHFDALAAAIFDGACDTDCPGCGECHRLDDEAAELLCLLPDLEHALDWGLSDDTCLGCARIAASRAIEAYLSTGDMAAARGALEGSSPCLACWLGEQGVGDHWRDEHDDSCFECRASRLLSRYAKEIVSPGVIADRRGR